jgi:hypothetical protein
VTIANSSGNKVRPGGITKASNRYLRQMLVVGAMAVIRHAERNGARRPWLVQLLARTATKHAAIALANKTTRIVWALMTSGESYRDVIQVSRLFRLQSNSASRRPADEVGKARRELMHKTGWSAITSNASTSPKP